MPFAKLPPLKDLADSPTAERFLGGHRLCAGCPAGAIVRQVLTAIEKPVIAVNATGCLEVATTIVPFTSWNIPWVHIAFENAAAVASGIEAAVKALKKRGVIEEDIVIVAFAGDGGTYDIGFQALSGAAERGHKVIYVLYDNEGYMNTGIQRSSSTPIYTWTTTSPVGRVIPGKPQHKKHITEAMVAHGIPYVVQTALYPPMDLMRRIRFASENVQGFSFFNVYSPCNRGWRFEPKLGVEISKLAVETNYWPVYEVYNGVYSVYKPRTTRPLEDFLKLQGRFSHLLKPENSKLLEEFRAHVDKFWKYLLAKEKMTKELQAELNASKN